MGGSSNRTEQLLHLAQVSAEKCELISAGQYYVMALNEARSGEANVRLAMEAISGLLRMADEARDSEALSHWEAELNQLMLKSPDRIPPSVWYCKGLISEYQKDYKKMQVYLHRAVRESRRSQEGDLQENERMQARAWVMLARMFMLTGRTARAQRVSENLLKLFEEKKYFAINTPIYMIMARLSERKGRFHEASQWLKKAHASSVGEHNWYQYLYVLVNTARLNRLQRNYPQALWFLDLVDQATMGPEFSRFKSIIKVERQALERNAADLVIDSRRGWVKTRESDQIPLRKQYILLNLLEELSRAHSSAGEGANSPGLTKSELIERVWKEKYRPQVHDNKLYYNINRLRKLIEPDMKNPQYLLSWREGYRLAPGLRVQWVQTSLAGGIIAAPGLTTAGVSAIINGNSGSGNSGQRIESSISGREKV